MLESSTLLIHPWQADGPTTWARPIVDGGSSAPLGLIRYVGPASRTWLGWLHSRRLDVLETEDAALLMTLLRPWGLFRLWDVYDAEERRVGSFYPPLVLDCDGSRRAVLESEGYGHGRLVSPPARPLAEYERRPDRSTRLQFAADLEPNPFLRMLLLGAVLAADGPPGRG
jgi:hypothetical protein